MILIYTSFGCTSAIKAKTWLENNNLQYVEKNIQSTLLNKDEIKYLLSRTPNGTEDIISKRSKAFRRLNIDLDELTTSDLIHLIQANPTILKRPIILDDISFVVGFDNDEITSFVPSELRNSLHKSCTQCENCKNG